MILLWGLPGDRPMALVRDELYRLGQRVAFLDQRLLPDIEMEFTLGEGAGGSGGRGAGGVVAGTIWAPGETIDLGAVRAVYMRPFDPRQLPDVASAGPGSPVWQRAMQADDMLWTWIAITPALVVNPPDAMTPNGSKPFQSQLIRHFGFPTPETLVTTDPQAAADFWHAHGQVIYKSVSGVRSIVSRLKPGDESRLPDVRWCPTQFQAYVPGLDYRAHVVGQEIFACQLASGADDYRYAGRQGADVTIRSCTLPADVAERCIHMAAGMRLYFAGIDLRCTPDGEWYCFEVNPSPGFSYFQDASGDRIDQAVGRLLIRGHP